MCQQIQRPHQVPSAESALTSSAGGDGRRSHISETDQSKLWQRQLWIMMIIKLIILSYPYTLKRHLPRCAVVAVHHHSYLGWTALELDNLKNWYMHTLGLLLKGGGYRKKYMFSYFLHVTPFLYCMSQPSCQTTVLLCPHPQKRFVYHTSASWPAHTKKNNRYRQSRVLLMSLGLWHEPVNLKTVTVYLKGVDRQLSGITLYRRHSGRCWFRRGWAWLYCQIVTGHSIL